MNLINLSARELNVLIKKKEISVSEIAGAYAQRIEEVDGKINAFISFDRDLFFSKAKEIDEYIKEGNEILDFTGIPVAIKDNICTKGIKTTCASKILSNYVSVYDATVIKNLNKHHFLM
ncbi:Asp-tRNA(Asn)/Glu-tRNA(Gln) amidotransferase subunit GatA, partial [bacterium]|nr:Asp-tRNA(Asn)/Glu-tRNA(Gln) amidotransferase subunit GatA [bacterium]